MAFTHAYVAASFIDFDEEEGAELNSRAGARPSILFYIRGLIAYVGYIMHMTGVWTIFEYWIYDNTPLRNVLFMGSMTTL